MKRFILLLVLSVFPLEAISAQELPELIMKVWNRATSPNPKMDPEYIYQISPHLTVSPWYTFSTTDVRLDNDLKSEVDGLTGLLSLRFNDHSTHQAGLGVGYGPISLSLGMEFGKKEDFSKSNSFRFFSSRYGLQVRYNKVSEPISGNLDFSSLGLDPLDFVTMRHGRLKFLSTDAYYSFNPKFSYNGAYGGRAIQKKSSGSPIVVGKFMLSDLRIDPHDIDIVSLLGETGRFSERQFSLGAGYSYNFVFLHRDPASGLDGFRNITFNLTAAPVLTVVDNVYTSKYSYPEWDEVQRAYLDQWGYPSYDGARDFDIVFDMYANRCKDGERQKLKGHVQPNFILRSGMLFVFNHINVNLDISYNMFHFDSGKMETGPVSDRYTVRSKGNFSDWLASVKLSYCF